VLRPARFLRRRRSQSCGATAAGITLGTIPVFIHQTLGYGDVIVGLVIAMQSLATIFTRGFAGHLIDTRGSKIAQIIGCVSMALGGVLLTAGLLCAMSPALSLTLLLLSRLALGFGESMSITGALAWGVSAIGHQRSDAVMVWVGIALYAAIGLGAPLGATLLRSRLRDQRPTERRDRRGVRLRDGLSRRRSCRGDRMPRGPLDAARTDCRQSPGLMGTAHQSLTRTRA
jgi:MFS family permease